MNKHLIYCILYLWMIRPTRENTPPEAFDLFEAGMLDKQAGKKEDEKRKYEKAVEIFPEFEAAWINLSTVHQDMGNTPLAIRTAQRALEYLPNSSAIWGILGTFYNQIQSNEQSAEEAFRKAIECDSTNSIAMANLGILLEWLGRYEEAEEFLAKSREVNPGGIGESEDWDVYIRKHLATVRSKLQLEGSSSSKEDMMSEIYSKDVAPLLRKAEKLIQRGELSEAEGLYKKAIKYDLNAAEIWFRLGTLYYQMGRRSEEKAALRRAIKVNGHHVGARVDLASTLIDEGQYTEAEKLLRTVISDVPKNYIAWMNLGKSLIAQGNNEEGEEALKRVIELKPDHVNAHYQLGKLYLLREDFLQAESALQKTVEYKPDHADGWIELGVALMKNDRQEAAEEAWKTAIRYAPNDDAPWVNLSLIMSATGRCDESKEALTRAQELAPNDEYVIKAELQWKSLCGGGANFDMIREIDDVVPDNLEYTEIMNTGAMMLDTGQLQDAEQCYRSAIALDKSNPDGWGMLGTVLRAQGRIDEALSAFTEALNLPKAASPSILLNYSIVLKDLGRENEAERLLKHLTKEHKEFAIGWFNYGNLYLKRSNWKQASSMYKKALEKNPDRKLLIKIKWNLGVALKEMKKYKQSEQSLLEALELDPSNNNIRTVLNQVRALQREE